jgi:hypothetical protein
VEHAARMAKMRRLYNIVVGKREGNRLPVRSERMRVYELD